MAEEQPKKKIMEVEKEKRVTIPIIDIQDENTGTRYQESVSIIEREILRFEQQTSGTGASPASTGSAFPFAEGTTSTNISGSNISGSYA